MYDIEMHLMSDAFRECWNAAGNHLNRQVDGGIQTWLRGHANPPFLEHLSFRLGNQLFFIRVEDVDGIVEGPGNARGHITAATLANGIACVLPMRRNPMTRRWTAQLPGWGLVDAATGTLLNPVDRVTDEKIPMTRWEMQDMAVTVVRDYLHQEGYDLMSWQGHPDVSPSLWFVGDSGGPEWVVVRVTTFPANTAARPDNWQRIADGCAHMSRIGHFASVALVSADQPFDSMDEPPVPLWRGYAMHVNFAGLEPG